MDSFQESAVYINDTQDNFAPKNGPQFADLLVSVVEGTCNAYSSNDQ